MPLIEQLSKDIVAGMKAKDELRLGALRMVKTALQKEISVDPSKPLTEAQEQQVLKSLVKQRMDSIEMFRKAGREEMAVKEEAEKAIIESYLPAAASEADLTAALDAALAETGITSLKQMGVVMKAAQAKLAGKNVDGKVLSEKVRARLS
jgi:uncharacterized protein YqeY